MPVLELLERPYCSVLRVEPWNAPAGRWFAAYRARHGYRWLLGNGVVDEFATVSSPLFFAPRKLLGAVYDAGIGLAHRRDADMALDLGWPPFCAGLDRPATGSPDHLERELLDLLAQPPPPPGNSAKPGLDASIGGYALERWRFDDEVAVIATNAPLLPQQLARLCDTDNSALTVALATGNRIIRQPDGRPQTLNTVSEQALERFSAALRSSAS